MVKHLHMAIASKTSLTGLKAVQEIEELACQHPFDMVENHYNTQT